MILRPQDRGALDLCRANGVAPRGFIGIRRGRRDCAEEALGLAIEELRHARAGLRDLTLEELVRLDH